MTPEPNDSQEQIRQQVEKLVRALTERPDIATVRLVSSHRRPKLIVTVHRMDYGAVLGKKRTMLDALNLLIRGLGLNQGLEVSAVLEESEDGSFGRRRKFNPSPDWDAESFMQLVNTFSADLFPGSQVSLEAVSATTGKITIVAEGAELWAPEGEIENALEMVFNCAGIMAGHRIITELIA